jgi:hypothetical protein
VSDAVQCTITHTNKEQQLIAAVRIMCERRNTLVFCIDPASPRITAFEIQEWIHTQLQVAEHSVLIIQKDATRRQVFLKFTDPMFINEFSHKTNGTTEYKYTTGEPPWSEKKLPERGRGAFD